MAGWVKQKGFGARVSIRLDMRKWTVRDLAVMVNCSEGYLYRVVRGEQEPSWSLAVNIAQAFGIALDELADHFTLILDRCWWCGREFA